MKKIWENENEKKTHEKVEKKKNCSIYQMLLKNLTHIFFERENVYRDSIWFEFINGKFFFCVFPRHLDSLFTFLMDRTEKGIVLRYLIDRLMGCLFIYMKCLSRKCLETILQYNTYSLTIYADFLFYFILFLHAINIQ